MRQPKVNPNSLGLVAFSFGQRPEEPSPCNQRLGSAVSRIISAEADFVPVVAQWEIALALEGTDVVVDRVVEEKDDGTYLDSDDIWDVARDHFTELGINSVIPVANRYIHLPYVAKMIRNDGFEVVSRYRQIGKIGFDDGGTNIHPWTSSRFAFTAQAVRLGVLGQERGHGMA